MKRSGRSASKRSFPVLRWPEWRAGIRRMGPSRMIHMAGVDVGARTVVEWIKSGAWPQDPSYRILCREMFAAGLYGQKKGQGYYRYEGRNAEPNPDVHKLAADLAVEYGVTQRRTLSSDETFERLLFTHGEGSGASFGRRDCQSGFGHRCGLDQQLRLSMMARQSAVHG